MHTDKFAITQEGAVYRLCGHTRPVLLGRISSLSREETPLGQAVRAWWQARLVADEPGENIVFTRSGDFFFVRSGGAIALEGQREEATMARMAAD